VTPTSVQFVSPAFPVPCDAQVTITGPDSQTGSVAWNPSPSIQQVVNNQGSPGGGGLFFLLGAFVAGNTVTVGGAPATIVGSSPIALLVEAPGGAPGLQPVIVTTPTGCTATTTYFYQ
jgi:IPT/TIG domain